MILVAGATGSLGGMIARQLLELRKPVRILVRMQSQYRPLVDLGAQPVFGDLKDPKSLERACIGVETVITTANAVQRGAPDTLETVDLYGTRSLIDAARAAGVKQFIYISALGANPDSPIPLMAIKGQTEAYLRQSGMAYTILQPNMFMEVWPVTVVGYPVQHGTPVPLIGEAAHRHTFISAADVAAFTVAAVGHPKAMHAELPLGGPEALSFRDVVARYEQVLGRSIPTRTFQFGEKIEGLPPVDFVQMLPGLETFDTIFDTAPLAADFGVKLTRLEDLLHRILPGAATPV